VFGLTSMTLLSTNTLSVCREAAAAVAEREPSVPATALESGSGGAAKSLQLQSQQVQPSPLRSEVFVLTSRPSVALYNTSVCSDRASVARTDRPIGPTSVAALL
jgi:hypothetical protein